MLPYQRVMYDAANNPVTLPYMPKARRAGKGELRVTLMDRQAYELMQTEAGLDNDELI